MMARDTDRGHIACPSPNCHGRLSDVTDTRPRMLDDVPIVWRRRTCNMCGARHTTIELTEERYNRVTKAQGAKMKLIAQLMTIIDSEMRAELLRSSRIGHTNDRNGG